MTRILGFRGLIHFWVRLTQKCLNNLINFNAKVRIMRQFDTDSWFYLIQQAYGTRVRIIPTRNNYAQCFLSTWRKIEPKQTLLFTLKRCPKTMYSKIQLDAIKRLKYYRKQLNKLMSYTKLCAFRCLISRPQIWFWGLEIAFVENYFVFLGNYVTSNGAVSHNDVYYQPLPYTRCHVRFYGNNLFE